MATSLPPTGGGERRLSLVLEAKDLLSRTFDNVRDRVTRGAADMANLAGRAFDTIGRGADAAATRVAALAGVERQLATELEASARAARDTNTALRVGGGRLPVTAGPAPVSLPRAVPTAGSVPLGPASPAGEEALRVQRLYRAEIARSIEAVETLGVRLDVTNAAARRDLLENIRQQQAWMRTVAATSADYERLGRVVTEVERRTREAGAAMTTLRPPSFVGLQLPAGLVNGVQRFGTVASGVFSRVGAAAASLRNALFSVEGAVLGLGLGVAAGYLVSVNREFQRLEVQIRTLTGVDQSAARGILGEIQRLATELPFSVREITEAFISLQAVGVAPTEARIRRLSDLASAMGGNLGELAHAIRRLLAGEADPIESQLAGSTFRIQGEQILATFGGITRKIRKDAGDIAAYLDEIASQFAGASAERMKTLDGAVSNLGDAFQNLAFAVGEAGLADEINDWAQALTGFTTGLTENQRRLRVWVVTGVEGARTVVATLRFVGLALLAVGKSVLGSLGALLATLVGDVEAIFAAVLLGVNTVIGAINKVSELNNRLADSAIGRRLGMAHVALLRDLSDAQTALERRSNEHLREAVDMVGAIGRGWKAAGDAAQHLVDVVNTGNQRIAAAKAAPITESATGALTLEDDVRFKRIQSLRADATASDPARRAAALRELAAMEQRYKDALAASRAEGDRSNLTRQEQIRLALLLKEAQSAQRSAASDEAGTQARTRDAVLQRIRDLATATQYEQTRADALRELREIEERESAALASGTQSFDERLRTLVRLGAVEEARGEALDDQIERLGAMVAVESTRELGVAGLTLVESALTKRLREQAAAGEDLRDTWERLQRARAARDGFEEGPDGRVQRAAAQATPTPRDIQAIMARAIGPVQTPEELANFVAKVALDIEATFKDKGAGLGLARLAQSLRGGRSEAEFLNDTLVDISRTLIGGFADAVSSAFSALVTGAQSAASAFAAAMLGAVAQAAKAMGDFFMAKAIGAFADALLFNPSAASAGAGYLAAATAMYAISGLIGGAASNAGGGGGSRGGSSFASERDRDLSRADRGSATVVWEGDYFDPRDPKQLERFQKMREEVGDRRMIIRTRGKRVRS